MKTTVTFERAKKKKKKKDRPTHVCFSVELGLDCYKTRRFKVDKTQALCVLS